MRDLPFNIVPTVKKVVIQPGTFCNLNCSYCYLPDKDRVNMLSVELASTISTSIESLSDKVSVIWHSGEPLSCGLTHFKKIFEPFKHNSQITNHTIQTNGTLLNDEWCSFIKAENIRVGISLDGEESDNAARVNRKGKPSFEKTLAGIRNLNRNEIPFYIISVISERNINRAKEIYDFMTGLGAYSLGINFEEQEGKNILHKRINVKDVERFWNELFDAWYRSPLITIREFENCFRWMQYSLKNVTDLPIKKLELIPTINCSGDIYILSPEFSGAQVAQYNNFIVGNIKNLPLSDLPKSCSNHRYYQDHIEGIRNCFNSCKYFSFCGGGQASNKFFENKCISSTETNFCINTRKSLLNVLINKSIYYGQN